MNRKFNSKERASNRPSYFPIMIAVSITGILCLLYATHLYLQIQQIQGGLYYWPTIFFILGASNMLVYLALYIKLTKRRSKNNKMSQHFVGSFANN